MKIKKPVIIKLLTIALCLVAIVVLVKLDNRDLKLSDLNFMYAKVDGHKIHIHQSEGKYYLFLPGYVSEEDVFYSAEARKHDIEVMKSANIATIYITTNSGRLDNILADKDHKESGKITVIDEAGNEDISSGLDYIKGRGNYSWNNWDKKPFKIQLSKTASLLGLGVGQEYALIANASDGTLIRNEIARALEVEVGIPFARTGRFVDLYINGDYMGNYYICSGISVGPENVNITDMDAAQSKIFSRLNEESFEVYETATVKGWNIPQYISDYTGGYLLEREFVDRYNLEYPEIRNGFVTDNEEHFIVKAPHYCTVPEILYISDFMNYAEKEILGDAPYGLYIDTESFAKRYLVEELLKNYDGGVSSAFYYKDSDLVDGKLYAGPGWDFDMSLGNYLDWMEYYEEGPEGITGIYLSEHSSIYYKHMIEHEEFNELVSRFYQESARDFMKGLVNGGISQYRDMLMASASMDAIRWADMYSELGYTTADSSEYDELCDFIDKRCDFLSSEWLK